MSSQNHANGTVESSSNLIPYAGSESEFEYQSGHSRGSRASDLLRRVTQYTEYSVASGEAGREEEAEEEARRKQHLASQPTRHGFWSRHNGAMRKMFFKQWVTVILVLCAYVLAVFSIYRGSMYKRLDRLTNLKVLVVVEDDRTGILTSTLLQSLESPAVAHLAGWTVNNYIPEDEVIDLISKEKYWGSIYVSAPNVSTQLVSAFQKGQNVSDVALVRCYYETARDLMGVSLYAKPALLQAGAVFDTFLQEEVYPGLIAGLSAGQFAALRNTSTLTNPPDILFTDGNPVTNPVLLAPLQVGLIYMIILSLFQILWFLKINGDMAKFLRPINYIAYRMTMSQVNCLVISLAYACLNRAFQIDMNRKWKGGFGVMWMVSFLVMSACGGANENIFLVTGAILPPLGGFWILFFVILNISATFSPIELCPAVFRFTYALPIKNGYELMKMILLGTYSGHIGRYFGVLVAWVVLNNLLMPFCLLFFANMSKKKIVTELAKEKAEDQDDERSEPGKTARTP
ncbi:DEKNAAC103228 [Brettanomyces naardenensis]|uniref:DEKNAAC103228 n=1 Tax=Brettanomyces naardenensis TaxID=13370 RepID=A0A448YMM3_BRENA|nr:DEKNAAC103228 [Brettanomyces naardenensis]